MKKAWFVACAILYFTASADGAAERNVIGNQFRSFNPNLNININTEFKYLGKTDNLNDSKRMTTYDDYIFVPINKGNKIDRYMFIQIRSREKAFKDNAPANISNFDFGAVKLNSGIFKYYKRLTKMPPTSFVVKFLKDAGYVIPTCLILNSFYSLPSKNMLVSINYNEDASPLKMSCAKTYSRNELSEDQKKFLAGFHKRAFASIGIAGALAAKPVATAAPPTARKDGDDLLTRKIPADAGIHARLAVFTFNASNLDTVQYGPEVTNQLISALKGNPAFSILDRRDLQEFLSLNDLQQNDNLENIVNIGRRLGLNFIVTGRVDKKGTLLVVNCYVVNIVNAKVVFTHKVQAAGDANLEVEVRKLGGSVGAAISKSLN